MTDLLRTNLYLFGEGAGDGGDGGAESGAEASAPSLPGRRGKSGAYDNVVFGKAPEAEADVAGQQTETQDSAPSQADREKAFRDMIQGEYKDLYTAETQKIINARFKETKHLQEQQKATQPVVDLLMSKYGISDGDLGKLTAAIEDDDAQWIDAADEAGMSVSQFKQFTKLQRENAQYQREMQMRQAQAGAQAQEQAWRAEAEQLKAKFPTFDIDTEIQNDGFARMLRAGVSLEAAYIATHADEIYSNAMLSTARATEEKVAQSVRANRARPSEAGSSKQGGFVYKSDVTKLTKADRAEAARRASRGDVITFQ